MDRRSLLTLLDLDSEQPTNTTGFGQQQPTNTTGFGQQQPTNTTGFGQDEPTNTTGFGQQPTNTTGFGQEQPTNTTRNVSADMAKSILDVMNGERKAVNANVPPLVWNNTAAAHAKAWVEYLAAGKAGGKIVHCFQVPGWEQIESCTHHEGENLVYYAPHDANRSEPTTSTFGSPKRRIITGDRRPDPR